MAVWRNHFGEYSGSWKRSYGFNVCHKVLLWVLEILCCMFFLHCSKTILSTLTSFLLSLPSSPLSELNIHFRHWLLGLQSLHEPRRKCFFCSHQEVVIILFKWDQDFTSNIYDQTVNIKAYWILWKDRS